MKKLIPDTIFSRLFLLMFVTLTASFFVGREVFFSIEHFHPDESVHIQPHSFRLFGFIMRLSGIALTAWIAARWLSRPINQMAQAAKELGENLEHAPLDESRGPSEIRQASAVFNQMQQQLKQQLAERNRFLAAVSHDLRTPITRLKLRAERIMPTDLKAGIQADLNEMAAMIDAVLDYLRGDSVPERECLLDVQSLVQSLAENAEERGETVTLSGSVQPMMVMPMALQRCLSNLIENALRYGNRADIRLDGADGQLRISIQDSGPGIPEEQLEAVFAPFYRLEQSRSRHTGGVGLGLSIARDLAQRLGGNLTLENVPQGGLAAILVLPKHGAAR